MAAVAGVCAALLGVGRVSETHALDASLASRLEAFRAKEGLPAVAGAIFRSTATVEVAAVGVRKLGDSTVVTVDDRWHVGSISKSFTSALLALAVERRELAWSSTLGELLGAERAGAFAGVSLTNLLTHRAGLPGALPTVAPASTGGASLTIVQQRRRVLDAALVGQPSSQPGERFAYSNLGYVVAAALLEARTGRSWEDMLREQVLQPLALGSAGFGAPGTPGSPTQPFGHRKMWGRGLMPVEPGPFADNSPVLGPAGTLHMTISDLARWGQAHLAGERGQDGLLRASTFKHLHSPPAPGADYAYGWAVREPKGRRIIWHNGSNTMWYAIVAFEADANRGVALVTNGSLEAARAFDALAMQILEETPPGR